MTATLREDALHSRYPEGDPERRPSQPALTHLDARARERETILIMPGPTLMGPSPVLNDAHLVESVHQYARNRFGEAWGNAVREVGATLGDAPGTVALLTWWTASTLAIDGRRVLEWFLEERGSDLTTVEKRWIDAQREAWLSIWEVVGCEPGVAVVVRDRLTGEMCRVNDVAASQSLYRRDAVLARVLTLGELCLFSGVFSRVLPPDAASVVVEQARARLRREGALAPSELRDPALGLALMTWWSEAVREAEALAAQPHQLQNTDGDPLMNTTDHYGLDASEGARAGVEAALRTMEGVVPPGGDKGGDKGGEYVFVRAGNAAQERWANTVVGRATVADDGLRLDTNSVARADRLRARVEEACVGLVRHRRREQVDPAVKEAERARQAAASEPMSPESAQAQLAFKKAQYHGWLDEPLAPLGGETPRQAVSTERGRAQVDLLLRTMENREQRSGKGPPFDFAELRTELDLPE
jgi:hypothetical protein